MLHSFVTSQIGAKRRGAALSTGLCILALREISEAWRNLKAWRACACVASETDAALEQAVERAGCIGGCRASAGFALPKSVWQKRAAQKLPCPKIALPKNRLAQKPCPKSALPEKHLAQKSPCPKSRCRSEMRLRDRRARNRGKHQSQLLAVRRPPDSSVCRGLRKRTRQKVLSWSRHGCSMISNLPSGRSSRPGKDSRGRTRFAIDVFEVIWVLRRG